MLLLEPLSFELELEGSGLVDAVSEDFVLDEDDDEDLDRLSFL